MIILVTTFFLTGCKTGIKDRLITKIEQNYGSSMNSTCEISLKEVTPFKWDRLYLFGAWISSDSIGRVIGINYQEDGVRDDYRRMLFTLDEKIVYEEDFESFDYDTSTINFLGIPDSLMNTNPHFLTPEKSVFLIKRTKIKGSCNKCYNYNFFILK